MSGVGEAARVRRASRWVGAVLWVVTGGAMTTAAATVTAWAIEHGMSPWVAWLVDPLLSVALLAALIGEGVLARHGRRGGAWPAVLRWGTGLGTLTANTWSSVAARDAAGVVLHAIAPALVVTVAEAAPRLRRRLADLADHLDAQERGSIGSTSTTSTTVPTPAPIAAPIGGGSIESTGSSRTRVESTPTDRVERVERIERSGGAVESTRPRPVSPRSTPTAPTATASVERAGARSIEACRVELAAAIAAGELPAAPSAEAIRRVLAVGPTRARALRDELAAAAVAPMPGQTAIDDDDVPAPTAPTVPVERVEGPALVAVGAVEGVAA